MGKRFIEEIKTEQKRIQRLIDLSARKQETGRGTLSLEKRGNYTYAYERWQKNGQPARKQYLGTPQAPAVRQLFGIRFREQRLVLLRKNQLLLKKLKRQYEDDDYDAVVSRMPGAYQAVARGVSFNRRYEELREWANADYPRNLYPFPEGENKAKDGTRLRSKGECLFYNLMQERGILFRNDCKLLIVDENGDEKVLCPDFLIQCFDGTFIIIEHLGRLGDLRYALDFGERCHWYLKEGFVLGRNFFVTSDDRGYGTDTQMIAEIVDHIERLFYGY